MENSKYGTQIILCKCDKTKSFYNQNIIPCIILKFENKKNRRETQKKQTKKNPKIYKQHIIKKRNKSGMFRNKCIFDKRFIFW